MSRQKYDEKKMESVRCDIKNFFFFSGHLMQTEEASEGNKFVQGFSLLRVQENNSLQHLIVLVSERKKTFF